MKITTVAKGDRDVVATAEFALDRKQQLKGAASAWAGDLRVGQRVMIRPHRTQTADQREVVFKVDQVVNTGRDWAVSLRAPDGVIAKWFHPDALLHVAALTASDTTSEGAQRNPSTPPVIGKIYKHLKVTARRTASIGKPSAGASGDDAAPGAVQELMASALDLQKQRGISFRDALIIASSPDRGDAEAHLGDSAVPSEDGGPTRPSVPLVTNHGEAPSAIASTPLLSLANSIAKAQGISLRAALAEAARRDPAAVKTYYEHFGLR
jgi:hypothetical protein